MKPHGPWILCALLSLLPAWGGDPITLIDDPPSRAAGTLERVLLVHSYHRRYPWTAAITRGVRQVLPIREIDLQVFHMDTQRETDTDWMRQRGELALRLVEQWDPAVVIAADDNAQQWFARHLSGRDRPQVVFVGVNGDAADYHYPANNVSGILERPHVRASIDLLQALVPDARRIAIINDASPTARAALARMMELTGDFEFVSLDTPSDFAGWRKAVEQARQHADAIAIYTYHTVRRQGGDAHSMPADELMAWTALHAGLPVVGFLGFAVDDGALCAVAEMGAEHGRQGGAMTLRLLHGESAGNIPITTAHHGQSMLNLASARRLGLTPPAELLRQIDLIVGQTP